MSITSFLCRTYNQKEISALDLVGGGVLVVLATFSVGLILYVVGMFGNDTPQTTEELFRIIMVGDIRTSIFVLILIVLAVLESWKVVKCNNGD